MSTVVGWMKRWPMVLTIAVLVPLQWSCEDGAGPDGVASIGAPTLVVRNGTGRAIWFVQVRPCGAADWSRDLLGPAVVAAGERMERAVTSGCMDVRLQTESANARAVTWIGLDLRSGATLDRTLETWSQTQ